MFASQGPVSGQVVSYRHRIATPDLVLASPESVMEVKGSKQTIIRLVKSRLHGFHRAQFDWRFSAKFFCVSGRFIVFMKNHKYHVNCHVNNLKYMLILYLIKYGKSID